MNNISRMMELIMGNILVILNSIKYYSVNWKERIIMDDKISIFEY